MDFGKLNKEQLAAATFEGKHLLVLAGAGTGKTRTIIARAIYLIEHGIEPNKIQILSFTKKSANEIVERIKTEAEGNPKAKALKGSTFHSWCMELITKYPNAFGLKGFTCIDEDDQVSAFKLVMGQIFGKKTIKIKNRVVLKPETIANIYSFALNTRCNLSDSIRHHFNPSGGEGAMPEKELEEIRGICQSVIQSYIDYKKRRHYIDYDDMLNVVALALKKSAPLKNQISSLYSHILVDEVQDTNPLQWFLLESFYDNCHLFCVGDDAQSIYAFRGADFKSVHSFLQRVPNSQVYKLTENYRSTQEILDVSNWLLRKSSLSYEKDLVAHRGNGQKPVLYLLDSDWEEANIVSDIVMKGKVEGKTYNDYMVLSRSVYGLRKIESTFVTKGIPYCIFGGTKLMQSAHVRDVVSAMRIVANYHDELAWMRYLTIWPNIGEVGAAKIIDSVLERDGLSEAINCVDCSKGRSPEMKSSLESIVSYGSDPAGAIDLMVNRMEPLLSKRYDNWDYRKHDFEALKMVASKCLDIASFIAEYILDPSAEMTNKGRRDDYEDDRVILSTIHSAKGLEADTCFIVNVTPNSFPSIRATTIDDVEEERRCLYVALTRAKNSLNIMSRKLSLTATIPNGTVFYGSQDCDVPIGEVITIGIINGAKPEASERRIARGMVLAHFYEGNRDEQMTEIHFRRNYFIKSDIASSDEKYFLNGLPDELVTIYGQENKDSLLESGFEHPWTEFSEDERNELLNSFDFS